MTLVAGSTGASLKVKDVSLSFGGLAALSQVSFSATPGTVLGIIGANGSGKTSLLNCIGGVYRPNCGVIEIDGISIIGRRPDALAALGVGRTFQHVEIPRDVTVLDVALLGRHLHAGRRCQVLTYGLGLRYIFGVEARERRYAEAALEELELSAFSKYLVSDLPYGLAKRVDLARVIAAQPRLLLLDEPAAGLNEIERRKLADILRKIAHGGMTVLLIEHDMSFVTQTCGRVLVLAEGRDVYEGTTKDALRDGAVVATFLGKYTERSTGDLAGHVVSRRTEEEE